MRAPRQLDEELGDEDRPAVRQVPGLDLQVEDLHDRADLDLIVQRIRLSFERPFRLGDVQVSITASIGVAFVEGGGQVTQALVTLADKAMYAERRRLPGSRTDLA